MASIKSLDRSPKKKPRRFRYGLGTLLLLALLATVIWAATAIQRAKKRDMAEAKRQYEAVRAITGSGGVTLYDFEDDTRYVDKMPTDTRSLPVRWMHSMLRTDMFADVVKVHTGPSPTLIMTDATLAHFEQLPRLQLVELSATKITDEGLKHLEGLTQLQRLSLAYTNITGSGLRHLKALSQLQSLDLTGTKVTDEGLSSLNEPTQLRELYLSRTQITDAGLEQLKGLPQLTELDLRETKVSNAAIERLRQEMPNCRIKIAR